MDNKVKVNRGDIFYAHLTGAGSVQSGLRPVIVISNDKNNKFSSIITVVPCTTKIKNLPVHVDMSDGCGFTKKSQALCEQVAAIPKESLDGKIGKATEYDMKKIERAMLIQLGFEGGVSLPRVILHSSKKFRTTSSAEYLLVI